MHVKIAAETGNACHFYLTGIKGHKITYLLIESENVIKDG